MESLQNLTLVDYAVALTFAGAVFHEAYGVGRYIAEHIQRRRNEDKFLRLARKIAQDAIC